MLHNIKTLHVFHWHIPLVSNWHFQFASSYILQETPKTPAEYFTLFDLEAWSSIRAFQLEKKFLSLSFKIHHYSCLGCSALWFEVTFFRWNKSFPPLWSIFLQVHSWIHSPSFWRAGSEVLQCIFWCSGKTSVWNHIIFIWPVTHENKNISPPKWAPEMKKMIVLWGIISPGNEIRHNFPHSRRHTVYQEKTALTIDCCSFSLPPPAGTILAFDKDILSWWQIWRRLRLKVCVTGRKYQPIPRLLGMCWPLSCV